MPFAVSGASFPNWVPTCKPTKKGRDVSPNLLPLETPRNVLKVFILQPTLELFTELPCERTFPTLKASPNLSFNAGLINPPRTSGF